MRNIDLLKLDYSRKIELSNSIVAQALQQCNNPAVSFSGGKNSLVVLHLLLQYKPDIPVIFTNTTNEFADTVKYVRRLAREWNLNLYELRPRWNFWKVVKLFGFPPESRYRYGEPHCCYILKIEPILKIYREKRFDANFTGLTAYESRTRMVNFLLKGCVIRTRYIGGRHRLPFEILSVKPIYFWNHADVLRYIEENDLPVNPVYRKYGLERCGCRLCTGHKGWREQLKRISPKLYEYVLKKIEEYGFDEPSQPNHAKK